MNSGWICACPRLVVWAVLERNRSETEWLLRPLDKNPLRAPTIFRTLRSPLAPCSALLTCSGIGISVTYYDMGQPLSVLQSHMVTLCYKFTCGILINFTIDFESMSQPVVRLKYTIHIHLILGEIYILRQIKWNQLKKKGMIDSLTKPDFIIQHIHTVQLSQWESQDTMSLLLYAHLAYVSGSC